ncbi:MAG: recombinase family protein [Microcystis sp. M53603_WE2]|uniref:recombinase family protein n=1 Tax=unclassified Microcystis TaxID=2643300 RepID=UPI001E3424AE|nr:MULTISPECIES: recombinase family protein [Microcystis]MCZ8025891.1 recombinase family protein [Microcystis sp. LE19-10.1B]MDJ0539426.1 recombinase family protein [Microcystis sp. M53603_WE2]MDJ0604553.1 recombinase family protein [Microcystis sp. M53602_WE12]
MPSGTIIITDDNHSKPDLIAGTYARVSSAENKDNLDRQADRLKDYAVARGHKIYKVVEEVGSGIIANN